ncbi:MAG: universal stress protein [Chloroflexi bacterium]|nr:universal stress protein [Chloroflexota bacterium]
MATRILVPLDGSKLSGQILPAVEKFVVPHHEYEIELLYVLEFGASARDVLTPDDLQRSLDLAEAYLKDAAAGLRTGTNRVAIRVTVGPPARAILERLEDGDFDYVFMATNGRSGLARAVVGSVTERVVRESPVPVVALHPQVPAEEAPTTGPEMPTDKLIGLFPRGDAISVRAMRTLVDRGGPAVPALVEALRTGKTETKVFAARALGRIKDEQALPLLVEELANPVWEIRWEAEEAIARYGQPGIEATLRLAQTAALDSRLNISLLHVFERTPIRYYETLKPVIEALHSPVYELAVPVAAAKALQELRTAEPTLATSGQR